MEERTESRGQNESQIVGEEKRNGRLVGAAETSKERAEWRRLQRKNLSILGLPKRKECPQWAGCQTGGMPDRVKSFREIDSRQDRPRARPGFVKPIRNGLGKVQNLIQCRPSRAETGLAGRENGIRFQKEE